MEIIGIDQGYGYVKTVHSVFGVGVAPFDTQPPFIEHLVKYKGRYYTVGNQPDGITTSKVKDDDYFILTLAGIAEELKYRKLAGPVNVFLAGGLPLTTFGSQREEFEAYLMRDHGKPIDFEYENRMYQIRIEGVALYPQGYSAIVDRLAGIKSGCYVVDIGTGTTDILPISSDRIPDMKHAKTVSEFAISACIAAVNEQLTRTFGAGMREDMIIDIIRGKDVETNAKALNICQEAISAFADSILNVLNQNKVNYMLTPTFIVGGGATLLQNYAKIDFANTCISFLPDIRLNARGYELLAATAQRKKGNQ